MNGDHKKDSAIKTLAIIGFTAMIVLGVWLAVQVVQLAPSAFTSLASLADDVYGRPAGGELTVVSSKTVVNNDETFELRWSTIDEAGEYQFTYACTDGVYLSTNNRDGKMVQIGCDQPFVLTGNGVTDVKIESGSQRFTDINYTLAFVPAGETDAIANDVNRVTVVNATIPQDGLVAGVTDEESEEVEETESSEETDTETTEVTTTEPETSVNPTTAPQPQYEFRYELPVSNPNGFVDLDVDYLGVGHLNSDDLFIPRTTIDNDARGALKFSVTNIGTKTSDEWTYEVDMPNGSTYESGKQAGLKPRETATIILGFSISETGSQSFSGEVSVDNDRTNANNEFAWSVTVTN